MTKLTFNQIAPFKPVNLQSLVDEESLSIAGAAFAVENAVNYNVVHAIVDPDSQNGFDKAKLNVFFNNIHTARLNNKDIKPENSFGLIYGNHWQKLNHYNEIIQKNFVEVESLVYDVISEVGPQMLNNLIKDGLDFNDKMTNLRRSFQGALKKVEHDDIKKILAMYHENESGIVGTYYNAFQEAFKLAKNEDIRPILMRNEMLESRTLAGNTNNRPLLSYVLKSTQD